jgi:hypothetical protein
LRATPEVRVMRGQRTHERRRRVLRQRLRARLRLVRGAAAARIGAHQPRSLAVVQQQRGAAGGFVARGEVRARVAQRAALQLHRLVKANLALKGAVGGRQSARAVRLARARGRRGLQHAAARAAALAQLQTQPVQAGQRACRKHRRGEAPAADARAARVSCVLKRRRQTALPQPCLTVSPAASAPLPRSVCVSQSGVTSSRRDGHW